MIIDRDEYLHEFATDALQVAFRFLKGIRPGRLVEFSVHREEAGDWILIRFTLDIRPGVEFFYRHGALRVDAEPQLSASSAAGIFMSSLIERTEFKVRPEAVDGVVAL